MKNKHYQSICTNIAVINRAQFHVYAPTVLLELKRKHLRKNAQSSLQNKFSPTMGGRWFPTPWFIPTRPDAGITKITLCAEIKCLRKKGRKRKHFLAHRARKGSASFCHLYQCTGLYESEFSWDSFSLCAEPTGTDNRGFPCLAICDKSSIPIVSPRIHLFMPSRHFFRSFYFFFN